MSKTSFSIKYVATSSKLTKYVSLQRFSSSLYSSKSTPKLVKVSDITPHIKSPFSASFKYWSLNTASNKSTNSLELLAGNIVLTGGASLMPGMQEVAVERFHLPVRIGKPIGVSGLVDVVASPAHATAVGLVRYGAMTQRFQGAASSATNVNKHKTGHGNGGGPGQGGGSWVRPIRNFFKDFF